MVWLALLAAWALFGFFCYAILRAGAREDALRERLGDSTPVGLGSESPATVVDRRGQTEAVPGDSEEERINERPYYFQIFI